MSNKAMEMKVWVHECYWTTHCMQVNAYEHSINRQKKTHLASDKQLPSKIHPICFN